MFRTWRHQNKQPKYTFYTLKKYQDTWLSWKWLSSKFSFIMLTLHSTCNYVCKKIYTLKEAYAKYLFPLQWVVTFLHVFIITCIFASFCLCCEATSLFHFPLFISVNSIVYEQIVNFQCNYSNCSRLLRLFTISLYESIRLLRKFR